MFGYALTLDVKNIKLAVKDNDNTPESREFISMLSSSEYFKVTDYIQNQGDINKYLDRKLAQCIAIIPDGFSQEINSGKEAEIQFLIDGVDANTATIIYNYINGAAAFYQFKITKEFLDKYGLKLNIPIQEEPKFWYNPNLNTTKFLIPGLFCMILITTAVILTCLSIVKEKETGTTEQLRVSPLGLFELIAGKTIPYTIAALLVAAFILLISHAAFGLTVKGSYVMLLLTTIVFLLSALSLGIFISTVSNSQQVAFQIAALATMLPTFILSGFIFPIESMPKFIQLLTNITPAKFYIVILRSIIIKGAGIETYWKEIISLLIFTSIFITLAIFSMKKSKW
jgi:ABC-2 type transport system permease protein